MRKIFLGVALAALTVQITAGKAQYADDWAKQWRAPNEQTRPWTFWYWMFGNVSDEGIRLDLEAMKQAGIGGFYLMPIKSTADGKELGGTSEQLSPEWWKRIDKVYALADSLNLQMGIHFCDGFALGGGPWIKPEESMQHVVWSDTIVELKGNTKSGGLPIPRVPTDGYYQDIATYVYPVTTMNSRKPTASVEFPFRATEPADIIMTYDSPYTLRSVRIVTGGNNIQSHRFSIYASDDGKNYKFVRQLTPARQGWQNTDAQATYSVPETTARYFKFHWTPEGSDPGSEDMDAAKWRPTLKVGAIELSELPVIDGYEGKSGAVWRVSQGSGEYILNSKAFLHSKDMQIIFPSPDGNTPTFIPGTFKPGLYRIIRMGHTSTLHTNATGGGGRGLECDKFSRDAIRKQLKNWFEAIYARAPKDVAQRVLTRLHVDSWECGSQNWSKNFADEFNKRRGYDITPWLPVMAGVPMQSAEKQEEVLRDIRLTIAELIDNVFFDEMEKAAHRYGVKLSAECVAPTMVSDGLLHYRHTDYPMGEYWLNSPTHDKPNDMLDAISGGHIYGKNIIQAEGFTEIRGMWDEHPAMLRPLLDANFCRGINALVLHVMTHNPYTDRRPGMTLDGIGTFFQRDNTWWREFGAFTEYISRAQALLQYGKPVVDLAVYTGDELPRRSILPERLTNTLVGLYDKDDLKKEQERRANKGQPMEVSPVGVTHSKNMTKAGTWVNELRGYKYDSMNHDALDGARVENGKLVTAGGMEYAALVVPGRRLMNPEGINTATEKIDELRRQGLRIIDSPWTHDDLSALGIERDIELPRGIDYTHRHAADADIYMLSNQSEKEITFIPQFRTRRAHTYIADAVKGTICGIYGTGNSETICLKAGESVFCILSDREVETDAPMNVDMSMAEPLKTADWTIKFEENGKIVTTPILFDWSQSNDNALKYYSGHATYTTTFKAGKAKKVVIDLGDVHNIATVSINGKDCGTLWTPPYIADITDALKKGTNELKITVVNTWANALLGSDLGTPPFDGIWTNAKFRRAEKTPIKAGLIGPVRIRTEKK